ALRNVQIGHVAGMLTARRQHSVFLVARIEMAAGRDERRFAFADSVHVNRVLAWRKAFDRNVDQHALRRLCEIDRSDFLTVAAFHRRTGGLGRSRQSCADEQDGQINRLEKRHKVTPNSRGEKQPYTLTALPMSRSAAMIAATFN